MRPRTRAVVLLAACLVLAAGLLVAGPAHAALHPQDHATGCDLCLLAGTVPVDPNPVLGPVESAHSVPEPATPAVPQPPSNLLPPSRAPPRAR